MFRVLLDPHSYNEWWPRFRWVAEITAIETDRMIAFRYVQGAWEGSAGWTLAPEADGIRVSYSIDIVPVPFWLRLLGRLLDLGAMHSKRIQAVFENLKAMMS